MLPEVARDYLPKKQDLKSGGGAETSEWSSSLPGLGIYLFKIVDVDVDVEVGVNQSSLFELQWKAFIDTDTNKLDRFPWEQKMT